MHGLGPFPVIQAPRRLWHQRPVSRYCRHSRSPARGGACTCTAVRSRPTPFSVEGRSNVCWSKDSTGAPDPKQSLERRIAAVQLDPVTGHSPSVLAPFPSSRFASMDFRFNLILSMHRRPDSVESKSLVSSNVCYVAAVAMPARQWKVTRGAARRVALAFDGSSGARRGPEPRRTGGMEEELAG